MWASSIVSCIETHAMLGRLTHLCFSQEITVQSVAQNTDNVNVPVNKVFFVCPPGIATNAQATNLSLHLVKATIWQLATYAQQYRFGSKVGPFVGE